MTEITTLLFDIGDVLIDIHWDKGFSKMLGHMKDEDGRDLTLEEISNKLHPASGGHGNAFDNFGVGKTNRVEFLQTCAERTGYKGDHTLLGLALTTIFEPLNERVALLNRLIADGKYNVALVSDTNEMHITYIEDYIPSIFQNIPVEKRFYSFNFGLQKRFGKSIYEYVLDKLSIEPQNALMIDDRKENKIGADEIGLNFLLIQKEENLELALRSEPYNLKF